MDEIDTYIEKDTYSKKCILSCFMALANEVTMGNRNLEKRIDQFDILLSLT